MDHLTQIDDPHNSELVAYLRKLVNNGVGKENANDIMKNGNNNLQQPSGSSSVFMIVLQTCGYCSSQFDKLEQLEQHLLAVHGVLHSKPMEMSSGVISGGAGGAAPMTALMKKIAKNGLSNTHVITAQVFYAQDLMKRQLKNQSWVV